MIFFVNKGTFETNNIHYFIGMSITLSMYIHNLFWIIIVQCWLSNIDFPVLKWLGFEIQNLDTLMNIGEYIKESIFQ